MRSTITSRGQITVPVWLRRRLGLRPGDLVCFVERDEGFVFSRVESPAVLIDWTGCLAKNCPADHAMRALRADADSTIRAGHGTPPASETGGDGYGSPALDAWPLSGW